MFSNGNDISQINYGSNNTDVNVDLGQPGDRDGVRMDREHYRLFEKCKDIKQMISVDKHKDGNFSEEHSQESSLNVQKVS